MNLAGSLVVCLLIVYRQSRHQKASLSIRIVVDSCSAVVFLLYHILLFGFSFPPMLAPESLILLGLFIVPAAYNIFKIIRAKTSVK
jgi:CBS domain containing-hemolysin-like protein